MRHRHRQIAVIVLAVGCIGLVTACGSSSSSSKTTSSPSAGARRAGLDLTSTQKSCLRSHGVNLTFGGGHGRFGGGTPPGNGQRPKNGKPPKGGLEGHKPSAGFAKQMKARLAAFKACDVSFPSRGGYGGGPPGSGG